MDKILKAKLEKILSNLSEKINNLSPGMTISSYRISSVEEFLEDLDFELAKLYKDKIGIQNYYDKNFKETPVYEE